MTTDLRFTLRALRQAPWYSATVAGVTALTLALATTVFAVVDGVLFRPLPYPAADRLVTIEPDFKGVPKPTYGAIAVRSYSASEADLANWQAAVPQVGFTAFNAYRSRDLDTGPNDRTAGFAEVQPNFFDVVGVRPAVGGFADEDFLGQALVRPVILSYETWQSRFGGVADILTRVVVLDPSEGRGFRIVGIMPRGFSFPSTSVGIDFLTPRIADPSARSNPGERRLHQVLARVPDDVSPAQLELRLGPGIAATAAQFPPRGPRPPTVSEESWRRDGPFDVATVVPLREALSRASGTMFLAVFAAVALLVLIAAVNLSSLMTARAWERGRELQMRRALGAPPLAIARLWALEAFTLFAIGAGVGVIAAAPLLTLVVPLLPEAVVLLKPARIDWRVGGFAIAALAALCSLVTIAPVYRSLRLPGGGPVRGGTTYRSRTAGRFLIVGGQVAGALVLTVVGACLVGSIMAVYANDVPVRTRDVAILETYLQGIDRSRDVPEQIMVRGRHIRERLEQVRGVSGAVLVTAQLLDGSAWSPELRMPRGMSKVLPGNDVWAVSEGFYRLLDFTPIQGRLPTDDELRAGAPLLVVSERIARAYWPGQSPIGQTLAGTFVKETFTVVGVVREVPWFGWDLVSPVIYGPYAKLARSTRQTFLVRTEGPAGRVIEDALRSMAAADPMIRTRRAVPLRDLFRETVSLRRFQSWLFGGFAAAALVVVGVGILGLLAMSTARRTKEIGIRCALGASPGRVTRLLVREQLWPVLAGLGVGGAVAAWAVGLVQVHVYRLSVADPRIWGAAIALVLVTAGLGALLPARRASRVDPLQALRAD